jgi:hypothetical protein
MLSGMVFLHRAVQSRLLINKKMLALITFLLSFCLTYAFDNLQESNKLPDQCQRLSSGSTSLLLAHISVSIFPL